LIRARKLLIRKSVIFPEIAAKLLTLNQ
jgi:hypothetical protein